MNGCVFTVDGEKRTLYFERYKTNSGTGAKLVRCVPKPGFGVFEIKAHYDHEKPEGSYYRLARTLRKAKTDFKTQLPWLDVRSVRRVTDTEELQKILSNPMRIPI